MKNSLLLIFLFLSTQTDAQWIQSSLNASPGRSLYSDGTVIYASTAQGVYYTLDTGEPWINIGPANQDIFDCITVGNKIIAGSGTSNGIFITTNNGTSWYTPSDMAGKSVYSLVKNDSYIFAGTWGQGVYRSNDEGETWESAGLSQIGINKLLTVDNMLYASNPGGPSKVYFSSDNGTNWSYGSLGYPASDLHGLYYNNGKLFACDFGIWASTDMGQSWTLQYGVTFDSTGYPVDITIVRNITAFNDILIAGTMFESILISPDNGINWYPFNEGLISDWSFEDVAVNGSYVWALRGVYGNAFRRPVSELLTDIDDFPASRKEFTLQQNYPNPFNPSTTIKYNLPERAHIRLTVFNQIGEKILTLADEVQEKGIHNVEFDAKALASGIYFYQLSSGAKLETRKMVLLK